MDATKVRLGPADALKLLDGVATLVACRGKRVEVFDLTENRPDDETLLARLLGPTGNLRAPTARVGKTLVVGFNEAAYREILPALWRQMHDPEYFLRRELPASAKPFRPDLHSVVVEPAT